MNHLWMHIIVHGGHALAKWLEKHGGHGSSPRTTPACADCGGTAETVLKCCDRPVCRSCLRGMIRSHFGGATFTCRFCPHTFTHRG